MNAEGPRFIGTPGTVEFFGRKRELEGFDRLTRDLSRGWGRGVHLWGPPGIGKTELLKHVHHRLFGEEGLVLPFYYCFPPLTWSLKDFALDFAGAFARQYLAFARSRGAPADEYQGSDTFLERLKADETGAGRFLVDAYRHFSDFPPQRSPAIEAALLPQRFTEASGRKVLVMLDDFAYLRRYDPAAYVGWPKEAFCSRDVSVVVAGQSEDELEGIAGSESLTGTLEEWPLKGLDEEEAGRMVRSLLRAAGVELADARKRELIRQTSGKPFALKALVQALGSGGEADDAGLQRIYAASVCRGEIYHYWSRVLAWAFPDTEKRRTALEVLVHCIREDQRPPEGGNLAAHMLKPRGEIEEALSGLRLAGMVQVDCARVRVLEDPTLRDFALSLYRRETGGTSGDFVEASLAAEKVMAADGMDRRAMRREGRKRLRELLLGWSAQKIPKVLFSAGSFEKRYGKKSSDKALEALVKEKELLTLPRVVSVASGQIGHEAGVPGFEADAIAWAEQKGGRRGARQVCWVVRISECEAVGADEVREFESQVSALQSAGCLPADNVVMWLISAGSFLPEAVDSAAERRVLLSTLAQAALTGRLVGRAVGDLFPPAPRVPAEERALEFEMSIPMVSETELVAARAVEQLAENMNFDPTEIGRIKMALVEACINAFEHSGREDDKVRLFFSADRGRLVIRVENRGQRFVPRKITPAKGKKEMTKRGWGLSLIRELMDDVEFEPKDDGVSLVMVKHLSGKEANGD